MIWLLVVSAWAQELRVLPDKPRLGSPVVQECPDPVGVEVGARVPASLVEQGRAQCAFVALPVSYHLYLEKAAEWALTCSDRYAIVNTYWSVEYAGAVVARDAALDRSRYWERWSRRQWITKGVFLIAGTGIGVGVGYLVL